MPRAPLPLFLLAALAWPAPPLAAAARDDQVQVDPQVVRDCRTEGQAMGMAGAQLDQYVRECVLDFYDTHVTVTRLPGD